MRSYGRRHPVRLNSKVSDLGAAAFGVGDVGPGVVSDRLDRCAHSGSERDGDRPLDVVGVEAVDQLVGPEPRVGAYRGPPGGPGASQVGDELVDESHHSEALEQVNASPS